MVLTAITTVVVLLFGAINVGLAQLRVSEAAAAAARASARGEDEAAVREVVARIAGSAVDFERSENSEYVTIYVHGYPRNSLAQVFHITLEAHASARNEKN